MSLLTPDEIHFRDTPCETREELIEWLAVYLDVYLPDCIVDVESSNTTPLDMVWKIYSTALRGLELGSSAETNLLFIGNRDGGKTFGAATAEFLLLIHDYRSVVHIGAIEKQAERAYMYFQDFFRKEAFRDFVERMVMKRTIVKNRGTFELLPCTMASVNGPHTPLVVRDEIDTVQDLNAYKDIKGIARQMIDKRPPIEVGISTRKSSFGLVQQEINSAPKTGMSVYSWNILEVTERCPDSRSGTERMPLYINIDTLTALSEEEWKCLPLRNKGEYKVYNMYKGCTVNCRLAPACRGFLKNQTCTSPYLRTLDRVTEQIFGSTEEWSNAQHLCRKPPKRGLVYQYFNEAKSVMSYKQMIEKFLGEEITSDRDITEEDLVVIFEGSGLTAILGIDFGYTNPCCVTMMYIDGSENVYVVKEFSATQMDGGELAYYLQQNWMNKYNIETVFADIESPSNIKMLEKVGFSSAKPIKDNDAQGATGAAYLNKDIKGGIETVIRFIKVPGTNETKLFVHTSCKLALREITIYHFKTDNQGNAVSDTPEKKDDHSMDSWRYPLHSKFGGKIGTVNLDIERSQQP